MHAHLNLLSFALVVLLVLQPLLRQSCRPGARYLTLGGIDSSVTALKVGRHRGGRFFGVSRRTSTMQQGREGEGACYSTSAEWGCSLHGIILLLRVKRALYTPQL